MPRTEERVTSPPSFECLLADHLPMIRRIAAAYEANPTVRDDLVQDVLYALWRALPAFRGDSGLRTFVARIAANRGISHVRRAVSAPRSAALPEELAAGGPTPESQAIAGGERARLLAAVRSLPVGLREPVLLALEGLTVPEAAAALGISPNAVAVRMTRARSLLRNLLRGES